MIIDTLPFNVKPTESKEYGYLSQSEMMETLGITKAIFARMRDELSVAYEERGSFKYYHQSTVVRFRKYINAERDGTINVSNSITLLGINQPTFYKTIRDLNINPVSSERTNEKLMPLNDIKRCLYHLKNKQPKGAPNFKTMMKEDRMEEPDVFESFAEIAKYTSAEAAKNLGIPELELLQIHKDKSAGRNVGYCMEFVEGSPVIFTDSCILKIKEYKQSLIESQKERLDNKQMEEAVHHSLKELFQNEISPKFSKLGNTIASLEKALSSDLSSLREAQIRMGKAVGEDFKEIANMYKEMQSWQLSVEDRLMKHTETLTYLLDLLTAPENKLEINKLPEKSEPSQPKIEKTETLKEAPKSDSLEDFDASFRKMKPEDNLLNNSLDYDECKKALDMYKTWIISGKLPADRKLRKLSDLARHIGHKLRSHYKSCPQGMSLTDFSNNIKANMGGWQSKTHHNIKRAALGLLCEWDELTIVYSKPQSGRNRTTLLFHTKDYEELTVQLAKQGIIHPDGISQYPN